VSDAYVCPECASAAFEPFSCGGPHPNIRKDGTFGKRRVYRFVEARPVGFCDASPMPKDGPALRTALADRAQQPARTQAAAANYNGGAIIDVTLVYSGGRAALPEDIFDALEAKYGSGKVVTDRDALTPGMLQMRILP
jgi:hypothetical protein